MVIIQFVGEGYQHYCKRVNNPNILQYIKSVRHSSGCDVERWSIGLETTSKNTSVTLGSVNGGCWVGTGSIETVVE